LRHTSRLEAVGRLAGGVAHDFNNILTVILGMTDLAQRRSNVDDRLNRDLDEIRHSAKRAARLTSQLLAFSRRQVITPVPCDLDRLVEGSLLMLQPLLGEDVELCFTCSEGEATVLADPTQIEQVLINLAVNARDAMPQGGRLEIETFPFHVSEDRARSASVTPGVYRCLQVRDHGTGIAPELLEHVFEPFFTTKELGRGTGLGLATTYGIVHQSGGFIDLTSKVGAGTTFRVYLPLIDAAAATVPAAEPHASEPAGGSQHILLVEDEPSVRELTKRLMESHGYRVTAAESGEQALALVDSGSLVFDLLLTDVILTGMSGRDLQERLRERVPALRVVYMSGYTDNIIAPHGVLEPGTFFVQKPFTSATIGAAVRDALQAPTTLAA
jgi:CheY-like chemotaxis protein